jgi:hypothetical protein
MAGRDLDFRFRYTDGGQVSICAFTSRSHRTTQNDRRPHYWTQNGCPDCLHFLCSTSAGRAILPTSKTYKIIQAFPKSLPIDDVWSEEEKERDIKK